MAKKSKVNKSEAIRTQLKENPSKPVAEIAKELGVTPGLVYNVKATMEKKAGKASAGKPGRPAGSKNKPKVSAPKMAHDALDSAFEFVNKVGGLLHAEQLINKLKSIRDMM
ncbi:MAG: hypothetical protein JNM18_23200 [Planctomycetaceae bacterium]|nr:hypothetical protein [Planctomycetaceae bacterium]